MCILCRVMVWKCICCCNLPKSVFPTLCRSVPLEAKLSDRQREYSNSLYSAVYPIIFSEKTACWAAAGQPACLHILPDKSHPGLAVTTPASQPAGEATCRRCFLGTYAGHIARFFVPLQPKPKKNNGRTRQQQAATATKTGGRRQYLRPPATTGHRRGEGCARGTND